MQETLGERGKTLLMTLLPKLGLRKADGSITRTENARKQ